MDKKSSIERLGYIDSDDGERYCECLVIYLGVREQYVLHEIRQYRDNTSHPKRKVEHKKVEFGSLDNLIAAFQIVQRGLPVEPYWEWQDTDPVCGLGLSEMEYERIRRKK